MRLEIGRAIAKYSHICIARGHATRSYAPQTGRAPFTINLTLYTQNLFGHVHSVTLEPTPRQQPHPLAYTGWLPLSNLQHTHTHTGKQTHSPTLCASPVWLIARDRVESEWLGRNDSRRDALGFVCYISLGE